jgi:MBG domain (YGX type)
LYLSLTWPTPAPITFGTPLSSAQLNVSASVPGTYDYNVSIGQVVVGAGTHILRVTFTPADSTDYATVSGSVTLTVNKALLTVTVNDASRAYGAANPTFADTITGFVLNQSRSVLSGAESLTTTATITSPAGAPITAAQGTLDAANYTFKLMERWP